MEVADRLGPTFEFWVEAPFAYALWTWQQLQDLERGRRWADRAARLESAELTMLAYHEPKRLSDERAALRLSARSAPAIAADNDRGTALARRLMRAQRMLNR